MFFLRDERSVVLDAVKFFVCLSLAAGVVGLGVVAAAQDLGSNQISVSAPAKPAAAPAANVPPDAPIITVTGLCDPPPTQSSQAPCKTVLTRAQFEEILEVMRPHAPPQVRRAMAQNYIQTLVKAQKAREMGLDKTQDFANRFEAVRLMISQKTLDDTLKQTEWDKISDREIEEYYRAHPEEYVRANFDRVIVPWFEPDDDPNKKLTDAEKKQRDDALWRDLKAEADKLHARALAGEDFLVLQTEAYKFTGSNNGEANRDEVTLEKFRRRMFTPALLPAMDLKPGQTTAVLTEDNGYYFFKMTAISMLPLEKVRFEIHGELRDRQVDKIKAAMDKFVASAVVYNNDYFGAPAATDGKAVSSGAAAKP